MHKSARERGGGGVLSNYTPQKLPEEVPNIKSAFEKPDTTTMGVGVTKGGHYKRMEKRNPYTLSQSSIRWSRHCFMLIASLEEMITRLSCSNSFSLIEAILSEKSGVGGNSFMSHPKKITFSFGSSQHLKKCLSGRSTCKIFELLRYNFVFFQD